MKKPINLVIADVLRYTARSLMLILSTMFIIFAMLSGAEQYGGGIMGVIKNSPNAMPWVLLLLLSVVAWKKELIGGIIITALGCFVVYYFNFTNPRIWWEVFFATLVFPILGSFFIISNLLRKPTKQNLD